MSIVEMASLELLLSGVGQPEGDRADFALTGMRVSIEGAVAFTINSVTNSRDQSPTTARIEPPAMRMLSVQLTATADAIGPLEA